MLEAISLSKLVAIDVLDKISDIVEESGEVPDDYPFVILERLKKYCVSFYHVRNSTLITLPVREQLLPYIADLGMFALPDCLRDTVLPKVCGKFKTV